MKKDHKAGTMGSINVLNKLACTIVVQLVVLHNVQTIRLHSDVSVIDVDAMSRVSWVFGDSNGASARVKRGLGHPRKSEYHISNKILIDEPECREDLGRLCGMMHKSNDDLSILECIQTFKANEVSSINDECQHKIWTHIVNLTNDENVQRLTKKTCGNKLDDLRCTPSPGNEVGYLSCLIDKKEEIKDPRCHDYIQRLAWVAFSDYRIITYFVTDCFNDIDKFQCGRIQPAKYKDISEGLTIACLQRHVEKLEPQCRKRILHVSEIQADNIKLDRQLYMSCTQDHIKFCPNIRPGSGQVYKCLMQHKTDRSMTKQCQDQLARREKLIASDYKVSKGLVRACKEDIKNNHCRRSVSEDKEIRLAQILLCLEAAVRNGSKVAFDCQAEMFDHRKILMEDYRLSPEIVDGCANDISMFCNGLEVGGKTIHCLMEHTQTRKKKSRISAVCQRALEDLIKETDAGEDWRVDPVLREACQPVVDIACKDVSVIKVVE